VIINSTDNFSHEFIEEIINIIPEVKQSIYDEIHYNLVNSCEIFILDGIRKNISDIDTRSLVKSIFIKDISVPVCSICCISPVNMAYEKCGHVTCETCSKRMKKCPYCKVSSKCVKIFFS
jgi:hypothetical protein